MQEDIIVAGDKMIVLPLKRLLYSRKVLIGVLALVVTLMGEFGLAEAIVTNFNNFALAIIASWTAKDVATNFANGKNDK